MTVTHPVSRAAYRSKKTSEVVRAYAVLTLCGVKPLVTHNAKVRLGAGWAEPPYPYTT